LDALDAFSVGITSRRVNWVPDADIRDSFTKLDHEWLGEFLRHRIADERVLRLIGKWLAAGVVEDGTWTECDEGSPQGGIDHAPNARGNFCFEVTLGHRRLELPRRGDRHS
jgi:retron-type reverse transcriptase